MVLCKAGARGAHPAPVDAQAPDAFDVEAPAEVAAGRPAPAVDASLRTADARSPSSHVEVVALDVTEPATIAALTDIDARAGAIHVLVNDAGIGVLAAFEDTDQAELRHIFETNFFDT